MMTIFESILCLIGIGTIVVAAWELLGKWVKW